MLDPTPGVGAQPARPRPTASTPEASVPLASPTTGPEAPLEADRATLNASPSSAGPAGPARLRRTPEDLTALRDAAQFGDYVQNQGQTNGCGTTSLAALLSFWEAEPGSYSRQGIDRHIRFGPDAVAFTSPDNIQDFARAEGYRSQAVNNASMESLQYYLDLGVPVQIMYDPGRSDGGDQDQDPYLHYVNVVGYTEGADGGIATVQIADPATGSIYELDAATFEARWSDLHVMGVSTGMSNVMIVTLPGENVPVRARDGRVIDSDEIPLPDGGMGLGGAIFDFLADRANQLPNLQLGRP